MRSFCLLCLLIIGSFGVRADAERTMQPVDLPGIRIHDAKNAGRLVRVRGVLDSLGVNGRNRSRSKYGMKKPKKEEK